MNLVAPALAAVLLASGVTLLVRSMTLMERGTNTRPVRLPSHLVLRLALGLSLLAAVTLITGWPVAGVWLAALGFALPSLIGVGGRRTQDVARIEAIATWAEMLRDQAAAGADLVQALQVSAAHAPPPIAEPVARLAIRLRRQPPEEALRTFANEVADPTADLVARALTVAFTSQARRVGDVLATLSTSAREQASMRLRIERDRARIRTVARSTGGVVLGWTVLVYVLSGRFFHVYSTMTGQLVLVLVGGLFAVGLTGLARLDRIPGTRSEVRS